MRNQPGWVGRQIGNYRIRSMLGQGGFAEVYLADHIHLNTQAAVKILHTRLVNQDVEQFRNEARTIARLIHPHIVRVLDFGVEDNIPYLVMDYAPAGTLRQHHPRHTRVALPTIVAYVRQVAEALQYAHEQRLIHRDIKPENMLVGRNHEILLSDFGIALATQSSHYQGPQDVAGTIAYMAPEQIQAHPRPASDQYALAIVVYEWLCGQRPFDGTYMEIAVKHAMVAPPSLCSQLPGLPLAVEQVVFTALNKDPHQRFAHVRAFAQALEQASMTGPAQGWPPSYPVLTPSAPAPFPPTTAYPYAQHSNATTFVRNSNGYIHTNPLPAPQTFPPSAPMPFTSTGTFTPPVQPQPARPRHVSRRAVIAGIVGLVATSSGITWFAVSSQKSGTTQTGGTTLPTSNPTYPSYTSNITPTPTSPPALVTYTQHTDYIWSVDWSYDGKYIVSGSSDGTAQAWDAQSAQKLLSYRSRIQPAIDNDWARSVAWSHDSKRVAVGFFDGTLQIVDITSRSLLATYGTSSSVIYSVAWSPDDKYIACGHFDNNVDVFEVASGNILISYTGHNDSVNALAWSPDGTCIVSGSSDGSIKIWRPRDGNLLLNYTNKVGDVQTVGWSHDGTRIVCGTGDGTVQIWEADTGHTLLTYTKHVGGLIQAVTWSHSDTYIASGGNDWATHIWVAKTGELVQTCASHQIFSAAWSPNDTRVVTAGYDKVAQVWHVGK